MNKLYLMAYFVGGVLGGAYVVNMHASQAPDHDISQNATQVSPLEQRRRMHIEMFNRGTNIQFYKLRTPREFPPHNPWHEKRSPIFGTPDWKKIAAAYMGSLCMFNFSTTNLSRFVGFAFVAECYTQMYLNIGSLIFRIRHAHETDYITHDIIAREVHESPYVEHEKYLASKGLAVIKDLEKVDESKKPKADFIERTTEFEVFLEAHPELWRQQVTLSPNGNSFEKFKAIAHYALQEYKNMSIQDVALLGALAKSVSDSGNTIATTIVGSGILLAPCYKGAKKYDEELHRSQNAPDWIWKGKLPKEIETLVRQIDTGNNFSKYGIEKAESGYVLHGKPGEGKTILGRSLAYIIGAHYIERNANEIVTAYLGESAKNLRTLFDRAVQEKVMFNKKYVIIFMDEFDAIGGQRNNSGPGLVGDEARKIVDQLLTLIQDGAKEGVIFIGATNYLRLIDAALYRSGRLVPVEITSPVTAEIEILLSDYLKRQFVQVPVDCYSQADLTGWAQKLVGNSRADIAQVVKEIAKQAALTKATCISRAMIEKTVAEYSKIQENPKKWMGKYPEAIEQFIHEMKHVQDYKKFKIQTGSGYLLYGPPGEGKTLLAESMAQEIGASCVIKNANEFISKYVGESQKAIRELIEEVEAKMRTEEKERAIIFIDEFDAIASSREFSDSQENARIVDQLLTTISELPRKNILLFAATNFIYKIDSAIKRSGRLQQVEIASMKTPEERVELLSHYLDYYFAHTDGVMCEYRQKDLHDFARYDLADCSRADIAEIARIAAKEAARKSLTHITCELIRVSIGMFK